MSSEEPSVVSDVKVAAVLSVDVDVARVARPSLQGLGQGAVPGDDQERKSVLKAGCEMGGDQARPEGLLGKQHRSPESDV